MHVRALSQLAFVPAAVSIGALASVGGCDDDKGATERSSRRPAVPHMLADGSRPAPLPPSLRRFRGVPVIGAKALLHVPPPVRSCDPAMLVPRDMKTRVSIVWLSPAGLTIEYTRLRAPSRAPLSCDVVRVKDRWRLCGYGSTTRLSRGKPARVEAAGGFPTTCSRVGREIWFMWIAVAPGTSWALISHDSYWVAYRSPGRLLRVSSLLRPGSERLGVRAAFLNRRGHLLEERLIHGYVAG